MGGGQLEVLCRRCGSPAKEGSGEEDKIDYGDDTSPTDQRHTTTSRARVAEGGYCKHVEDRPQQVEIYVHPFKRIPSLRHTVGDHITFATLAVTTRTHNHTCTTARSEVAALVAEGI